MDLVYGLELDKTYNYEEFKDVLRDLGYKSSNRLGIYVHKVELYRENSDLAYEVCRALNYSAEEYSDEYMEYESLTLKQEKRFNELLLEAVRTFQKEFNYEPNFYNLIDYEFKSIEIIDDGYNFKII